MLLVIDTETSWLYDFAKKVDDDSQPYIVQLAWLVFDDNQKEVGEASLLIAPQGLYGEISPEASAVHGISYDSCERYGIKPYFAFKAVYDLIDSATTIIGHNIEHDLNLLQRHASDRGMHYRTAKELKKKTFCTMRTFTKHWRLPGVKWDKWPSLSELHEHYYGVPFESAHDALADCRATAACYFEMIKRLEGKDNA